MSTTRWQDLYNHLKTDFDVYSPTQKQGECKEPYIVIKDAGIVGLSDISSCLHTYELLCYVPYNKYSTLESFVSSVEEKMDELFPLFRPIHSRTASFYDDDVKAQMITVQYGNYVKNNRR